MLPGSSEAIFFWPSTLILGNFWAARMPSISFESHYKYKRVEYLVKSLTARLRYEILDLIVVLYKLLFGITITIFKVNSWIQKWRRQSVDNEDNGSHSARLWRGRHLVFAWSLDYHTSYSYTAIRCWLIHLSHTLPLFMILYTVGQMKTLPKAQKNWELNNVSCQMSSELQYMTKQF